MWSDTDYTPTGMDVVYGIFQQGTMSENGLYVWLQGFLSPGMMLYSPPKIRSENVEELCTMFTERYRGYMCKTHTMIKFPGLFASGFV